MLKAIARWLLKKDLRKLYSTIVEQEKEVTALKMQRAEQVLTQGQVRQTNRLAAAEYQRFKAGLPQAVITGTSTELQAAALVGQQMVLNRMEQELVVG